MCSQFDPPELFLPEPNPRILSKKPGDGDRLRNIVSQKAGSGGRLPAIVEGVRSTDATGAGQATDAGSTTAEGARNAKTFNAAEEARNVGRIIAEEVRDAETVVAGEAGYAGRLIAEGAINAETAIAEEARIIAGEAREAETVVAGEAINAGRLISSEARDAEAVVAKRAKSVGEFLIDEVGFAGQLIARASMKAGHAIADAARTTEHLIAEEAGYVINEAGNLVNEAGYRVNESGYRLNEHGHPILDHIAEGGESGRTGFNLLYFLQICWRSSSTMSMFVNILWPVVPPAIALHYYRPDIHLWIFILNYVAMIPCANLIGFAGSELARKLPKVFGILVETTLGSVVEIVMFMVLLSRNEIPVIQAAALGSIMATLLLCLGQCFFWGGLLRDEQEFSDAISEVGSGLLLTAGLALMIPAAFQHSLSGLIPEADLTARVLHISRVMSVILIIAYGMYVWFQMRSHNSIYDAIFEQEEELEHEQHPDAHKYKLTFTECVVALTISITLVTIIAISLVEEIPFIVKERGISDTFMGLILVPLVEKAAEHLTAVEEAWENEMNLALAHVLGATIQTALFNTPLTVIVGWGLNIGMDLNFEIFAIVTLILSILVVGNFLRDQKSTYLEGALCVMVYLIVAVAAFYFPNLPEGQAGSGLRDGASGLLLQDGLNPVRLHGNGRAGL